MQTAKLALHKQYKSRPTKLDMSRAKLLTLIHKLIVNFRSSADKVSKQEPCTEWLQSDPGNNFYTEQPKTPGEVAISGDSVRHVSHFF